MSAPKHTPGPWRYERARNGAAIVFGGPGCTFPVMESPVEATEFYTEEREANAALIAAAPEMLAALKAAWLAYEPQYISACAEDSERTDLDDAFDGVRAAIAKAEGRAP